MEKLFVNDFSIFISLKANPYLKYDMADKLKSFVESVFSTLTDTQNF